MNKTMKKTFYVNVRYSLTYVVPVDAETPEEAIKLAREECDDDEETQDLDFLDATIED